MEATSRARFRARPFVAARFEEGAMIARNSRGFILLRNGIRFRRQSFCVPNRADGCPQIASKRRKRCPIRL
jgi:hypothetical protein